MILFRKLNIFKVARKRREIPSETPATKKFKFDSQCILSVSHSLNLSIDDNVILQDVTPIIGNSIVNLSAMV